MDSVSETSALIPGRKISGTAVYNTDGENIGAIYDVMIDKHSGKIIYALMSFGGFLGVGKKLHPLPWSVLQSGPASGGYVVHLSKAQLEAAPSYPVDLLPDFSDRDEESKLHRYYGVPPY